jgi:hypothetical protein
VDESRIEMPQRYGQELRLGWMILILEGPKNWRKRVVVFCVETRRRFRVGWIWTVRRTCEAVVYAAFVAAVVVAVVQRIIATVGSMCLSQS